MATSDQYNVLIVDPESSSRAKMKQAASVLTSFRKVNHAPNMENGMREIMDSANGTDIVFVSYSFGQDAITPFVESAKQTSIGDACAYILILKASDQSSDVVANNVGGGIDGFLFEPYSADALREIAEIAARVKMESAERKRGAVLRLHLRETMQYLDLVSYGKKSGQELEKNKTKFIEAAGRLKKASKGLKKEYVDLAIREFADAIPVTPINYNGVSERVRKRMEAKRARDIQKRYEEQNATEGGKDEKKTDSSTENSIVEESSPAESTNA
jgi:response regulator RpfG family c-di-GMP phosphodiesterase